MCLAYRLILVALVCVNLGESVGGTDGRPNLLFIFTDDQPQNCMSCMGNAHIETPHLDQLARQGVLFNNAFVTTAICCSNRACILTGQHMRRHGIEDFATPLSNEAFSQTYPALLRAAGYRTGFLGKFAIGRPDPEIKNLSLPADMFDGWYGFPQSINFLQVADGQDRYLTTCMEEEALSFLKSQPVDQPFCLTVALKEPHGPFNYFDPEVKDVYAEAKIPAPTTFTREHFNALPDFVRNSLGGRGGEQRLENPDSLLNSMRTSYRLISRADLAVGRLVEALQETGFSDDTVVIFTSDHGSMHGAHGLTGKWLMYEESIRVPFIVYDPRLPPQQRNRREDKMVLTIDVAPTLLAMAGVAIPNGMQGVDITPLVHDQVPEWREDWYYEHTYANPPVHPIPRTEGVRTNRWKYVRYTDYEPAPEQLFDLEADALEEHDLAKSEGYQTKLRELRQRCDVLRAALK